jgi:hypothetical protein
MEIKNVVSRQASELEEQPSVPKMAVIELLGKWQRMETTGSKLIIERGGGTAGHLQRQRSKYGVHKSVPAEARDCPESSNGRLPTDLEGDLVLTRGRVPVKRLVYFFKPCIELRQTVSRLL